MKAAIETYLALRRTTGFALSTTEYLLLYTALHASRPLKSKHTSAQKP